MKKLIAFLALLSLTASAASNPIIWGPGNAATIVPPKLYAKTIAFTGSLVGNLTGTASGNTTYTPNNHGVVISSATNAMTVLAPGTLGFPLVSGGASADPTYSLLGSLGGGTGLNTSALTGTPIITAGVWSVPAQLTPALGGTGITTAASTGVPIVTAGTWTVPAQLTPALGGTGITTAASTGLAKVAAGTWSVATLVNADVSSSAAIARSKIAAGTNNDAIINDGSGNLSGVAPSTSGKVLMSNGTSWASTALPNSQIRSYIKCNGGNGAGGSTSGETSVRNVTTCVTTGSAITYTARTTTTGDKFTINEAGHYSIHYTDVTSTGSASIGVSVNSNQLTTSINSITDANIVMVTSTPAANIRGTITTDWVFAVNDVVRMHGGATPANGTVTTDVRFQIFKVND